MAEFKIGYRDPGDGEYKTVYRSFDDTPATPTHGAISASEWADDYAYALADKGPYTVTKMKESQ